MTTETTVGGHVRLNDGLERTAFERWFSDGDPDCHSIRREGEGYKLMAAHQAWSVWKVRAAMQIVGGEYVCPKCGLRQALGMESASEF